MAQHVINECSEEIKTISGYLRSIEANLFLYKFRDIESLNEIVPELYEYYNRVTKINRNLMMLSIKRNKAKRLQAFVTDLLQQIYFIIGRINNLIIMEETRLMSLEDR
jgi:hypothetical protein